MAASTIGDITVLFLFGVLVFFAGLYLSGRDLSSPAMGAGIKGGSKSGKNETNNPPADAPGWYEDPCGMGQRYWDGRRWTAQQREQAC
jgi:hypothetical protein